MAQFKESSFSKITVDVDGNVYRDCNFQDCVIRYGGTGPVTMIGCRFVNCRLELTGGASNTIGYLSSIYGGLGEWGQKSVEALFEQIRNGIKL